MFNSRAGTAATLGITADILAEKFRAAGLNFALDANDGRPLDERIGKGLQSGAGVIVAAGGDGTATAIASALVETDTSLALLPFGTANLLARDLGIPLDVDEAIATLTEMKPQRIDVGEVNGRVFLHKAVIGTFPGIAAAREEMRGDRTLLGKVRFARRSIRRIGRARRMAVEIDLPQSGRRIACVHSVAIANNAYDEGLGRFFSRQRLDRGTLTLYLLKRLSIVDLTRLAVEMLLGRWRRDYALVIEDVTAAVIRTWRPEADVMIDGEVERMAMPLSFSIRPRALCVIAPAIGEPTEAGSASCKAAETKAADGKAADAVQQG
ncbi:diacylglycerol/lipid kinase family protein [Pseudorhizobium tarimense]|uniref:diacylglycerol/lipid kinase family protein n=1 Tax=Pseudorhizobium tarimense TaxID=1079109 RepID=UPI001FF5E519|nr:diacylglycerol kinase family protein [Pseudorhizobium tarimense]MCJ8519462.1 diacylglycerol kinase [Pseudorhizobium tarimense]